ncbi:MAG TPA: ATP-grasp domain-containing protein [Cellvibrionaceae bacterium]
MPLSLLVLDANQRSALAVTRSLGRLSEVVITTAESTPDNLAGASRFSSAQLVYPCPETAPQAFIAWMAKTLVSHQFDWVFPTTEVTSQLLLSVHQQIPGLCLPFAPLETVMALADKGALTARAQDLNVPVPHSRLYANRHTLVLDELRFPLVIKPCLSKVFLQTHWLATSVFVAENQFELEQGLAKRPYLSEQPFMVQEFIPGAGAGVFALYNHGKAVAFFAHQRLREKPPEGGISVLSQSAKVTPELERYARRLLDDVGWHGVAMVEFRKTPSGEYYLMEVNTRFWGSLQLAIDAGVDFPSLLLNACEGRPLPDQVTYQVGQRLRWLLGDVDSLYIYLRGRYSLQEKLRRIMAFLIPTFQSQRYEVNRWGDLRPAWYEIKKYLEQFRR